MGARTMMDDTMKRAKREDVAEEERRTVYITSIPSNFTERELHNMFAFAPGYQRMQTYAAKGGTGCFALFDSNLNAQNAMASLEGYVFDQPSGFVLKTEMARRNLNHTEGYAGPLYKDTPAQQPVQA